METDRPLAEHWIDTPCAFSWVAFRKHDAIANWDEFSGSKLHRSWPEWGFKFGLNGFEKSAATLLDALRSRAEGKPWPKPDHDFINARTLRAHVRRLMRDTGVTAATLSDQLAKDIAVETDLLAMIDRAQDDIIAAVRDNRIKVFGRRAFDTSKPNPSAVHEILSPELFLGPRVIDLDGWVRSDTRLPLGVWVGYKGPYFDQVRFLGTELLALWPSNEAPVDISPAGAPSGFLFVDEAAEQLRKRCVLPEGPTVKAILDVIQSGEVRFWKKAGSGEILLIEPSELAGAYIDLTVFRTTGRSGIKMGGSKYHLHRFLLSEDDFSYWLAKRARQKEADQASFPSAVAVPESIESRSGVATAEWMAKHVEEHVQRHGVPIKRDDALKDCCSACHCPYRVALAAWKSAPAAFKRNPRQTDRALTVQRAHAAR